jgi:hypothetical protein
MGKADPPINQIWGRSKKTSLVLYSMEATSIDEDERR